MAERGVDGPRWRIVRDCFGFSVQRLGLRIIGFKAGEFLPLTELAWEQVEFAFSLEEAETYVEYQMKKLEDPEVVREYPSRG